MFIFMYFVYFGAYIYFMVYISVHISILVHLGTPFGYTLPGALGYATLLSCILLSNILFKMFLLRVRVQCRLVGDPWCHAHPQSTKGAQRTVLRTPGSALCTLDVAHAP